MAHILIADDEQSIRDDIRQMLLELGHTCEEADSFRAAIAAVRKSQEELVPFDLLILDHTFEYGATGFDIMRKLGDEYCEHRVIILTGNKNLKLPTEAAGLGAIGYQLKPIQLPQLHASIETALGRRFVFVQQRQELDSVWEWFQEVSERDGLPVELAKQLEQLRGWNETLKSELQNTGAGARLEHLISQYERQEQQVNQLLNQLPLDFDDMCSAIKQDFRVSRYFIDGFRELFESNRYRFKLALDQLLRYGRHPRAKGTKIEDVDGACFEYYVGRDYRVYFRWVDGEGQRELVAFGPKTRQDHIIKVLRESLYV